MLQSVAMTLQRKSLSARLEEAIKANKQDAEMSLVLECLLMLLYGVQVTVFFFLLLIGGLVLWLVLA